MPPFFSRKCRFPALFRLLTQSFADQLVGFESITANAFGDIDLEDLMFAAGLSRPEVAPGAKQAEETVYDRFRSLPAKDRRTVEEFIEFLYARSHQEQESHQDNQ